MTPYETNKAGVKRTSTVDYWASQTEILRDPITGHFVLSPHDRRTYLKKPVIQPSIYDNVPLIGFIISDMVRRYQTKNVLWRVIDPRGFELELSSDNMNYLIQENGIGKAGIIDAPCVWGRIGAQNYLIPENTIYYSDYHTA